MLDDFTRFQGEGPYPCELERLDELIESYSSNNYFVTYTRGPIDFPEAAQHEHKSYEFIIPLDNMPCTAIEKRELELKRNSLLPINARQPHGPGKPISGIRMLAIGVEETEMSNLAYALYNRRSVFFKNQAITFNSDLYISVHHFLQEARNQAPGYPMVLESLAAQIGIYLLRSLPSNLPSSSRKDYQTDKQCVKQAIEYMNDQYSASCSLNELAHIANMSTYHFIRIFKSTTGKTPYDYLLDLRIQKAQAMMTQADLNITEIAFQSGFKNTSHFSNIFKQRVGISPTRYRKMIVKQ